MTDLMLSQEIAEIPMRSTENRIAARFGLGHGPVGETCRTCGHMVRKTWNRVYLKCDLWDSNGPASDIRLKWPACSQWLARGQGGEDQEG